MHGCGDFLSNQKTTLRINHGTKKNKKVRKKKNCRRTIFLLLAGLLDYVVEKQLRELGKNIVEKMINIE
jgi:hypothetical protein